MAVLPAARSALGPCDSRALSSPNVCVETSTVNTLGQCYPSLDEGVNVSRRRRSRRRHRRPSGATRARTCRCGRSHHRPCDGGHFATLCRTGCCARGSFYCVCVPLLRDAGRAARCDDATIFSAVCAPVGNPGCRSGFTRRTYQAIRRHSARALSGYCADGSHGSPPRLEGLCAAGYVAAAPCCPGCGDPAALRHRIGPAQRSPTR